MHRGHNGADGFYGFPDGGNGIKLGIHRAGIPYENPDKVSREKDE